MQKTTGTLAQKHKAASKINPVKLLASMVITLSAFSAFAQSSMPPPPPPSYESDVWGEKHFHLGLNFTTGIYWTHPNTSNNASNGVSAGYGYGANLEFYFTRNYGFLTGFEVTNIGAKYATTNYSSGSSSDSTITHNESLQYFEIPLILKMKTNPIGRMRYFGLVGLKAGFLLKATDSYTAADSFLLPTVPPFPTWIVHSYSANNADIYHQTDFFRLSLVIGLGAEYSIAGSSALQASLVYNSCFTNLNSSGSNSVSVKGVELMLGVLF